ncbi:MAG: hypothetical protein M1825_005504 [Sarcosagium campestre]|nr:MAG: hypothetical protein M1825_005504 [Sarcosagium campestre]
MLIDGEKWACDACVRGHRVSNCQHSDRALQHINKKGRPVSQCPHCRVLRKSRSSHVKCDCGEKGHTQSLYGLGEGGDAKGGKCTCSLKKDHTLDPVPELDTPSRLGDGGRPIPKPRLMTAQSEGTLTVFSNGHHKPIHKNNQMAHRCGVPYKIPRAHTIHGHSEYAQRSTDHLPMSSSLDNAHALSNSRDPVLSPQPDVRLVRSEHSSPHASATSTLDQLNSDLPPLDLSLTDFASKSSRASLDINQVTSYPHDRYFSPTSDPDTPIFSAGLEPPSVDWSALDLENTVFSSGSYSQPPSYSGFEYGHFGQPTSASVAASEPDDFAPLGNPSPVRPPSLVHNQLPSDSSEVCESDNYRLSTASSFHGLPQMSLLSSTNLDSIDIDDFLSGTAVGTSFGGSGSGSGSGSDANNDANNPVLSLGAYPLSETRKLGPTSVPADDLSYSVSVTAEPSDSNWMRQFGTSPIVRDPDSDAHEPVWGS